MCIKPSKPKIEAPQPAPKRSDVDTGNERRKISQREGVFGNIFTSPLGDSSYGTNAQRLAQFGA
jgi:hypothetical protein